MLYGGPINDGLLMIAELVQNRCMFDEDHLERWCMARNLVGKNLEMPLSQEPFQLLLGVCSKGPWGTECRCSWSRFSIPPFDVRIDCIQ